MERDRRHVSLARKVQEDRPSDVSDRCSNIPGVEAVSVLGLCTICQNKDVQTRYATPAMVAGEGLGTDVEKCKLEPLRQKNYYPLVFTSSEWATLQKVFPSGICDWTDGGVSQRGTIPWLTYQKDAPGASVVYGGRKLPRAAGGSGSGWASSVFGGWRNGSG